MLSVIFKAITKLKPAGSAAVGDVIAGKTFYNTSAKEIRTGTFAAQSKTVTAGTSNTTVTPDSGKYLSSVTVAPTPAQTKTVTPSTSAQTITPDSGKYLSSVTVNAIPIKTQTVSQTISIPAAGGNTTKTYTFTNLSTVYGITKIQKTSGGGVVTLFTGYPDAGTGDNALNIPSGGISGNKVTQRFINNSDASNVSAVIAITAIGI